MDFNEEFGKPFDPDDHDTHGPDCIHKQLMRVAYEDLIQAYSHIETAASALDFLLQLKMTAGAEVADEAMQCIDFLGGVLYGELHRRGSSVVLKPPSEH